MKKTFYFIVAALVAASAFLTSCGNEIKPLKANQITSDLNEYLEKQAKNEEFTEVAVGTYECGDPYMREKLAKLEVAGILDYEVTRYAWWEKSKKSYKKAYTVVRGYGWYSWTDTEYRTVKGTSYDFEDHYVVTVALTKKGNKMTVDSLPKPIEKIDEDLISKEFDASEYEWNQVDLSESWDVIENPFIEKKEPKTPKAQVEEKEQPRKKTTKKVKTQDPTIRIDSLQYEAYMNVEEVKEVKFLRAGAVSAVKARNIYIDGNYAEAEVIFETSDATDAGRILKGFEDGQKYALEVSYEYFHDKGWVLVDVKEEEEVKVEEKKK